MKMSKRWFWYLGMGYLGGYLTYLGYAWDTPEFWIAIIPLSILESISHD